MEGQGEKEDCNKVRNNEGEGENQTEATFGFPILDTLLDVNTKNIPPSLPTFYGKSHEDSDTFLFKFDILYRSYNYLQDAHKLKLFLDTLKYSTLRWFMGLGESTIRSWDDMRTSFLRKYQEYCKSKDSRHDIFKIQQLEDKILEDYLKRFVYTLHKSKYHDLREDAIRTLFLKGISEDLLENLNLMETRDIFS